MWMSLANLLRNQPRIGPIGVVESVAVACVGDDEPQLVDAGDIDIDRTGACRCP